MHIHLPKPPENWRELLKEVGVIVIGILIALALEQVVESWRWSRETGEAREAREALNSELGRNLGRIQYLSSQDACAAHRLDEIEKWRIRSASGGHLRSMAMSTPRRSFGE